MRHESYGVLVPGWFPRWEGDAAGSFFREQYELIRTDRAAALVAPNIASLRVMPRILREGNSPTSPEWAARPTPRLPWKPFPAQWNDLFRVRLKRLVDHRGLPKVVHLNAASMWIDPDVVDRLKRMGIRVVATEHQTQLYSLPESPLKVQVKAVLTRVDEISAVSSSLANCIEELIGREVSILPNAVTAPPIWPSAPRLDDTLDIVTVCGLRPVKRVDLILESVRKAQERGRVRLRIVGDGPSRREIESLAENLELADCIVMYGDLPRHRIPNILALADVYVNLSSRETFGLAVAEALTMGLPVVCSDSGGPRDFIGPHSGVLLGHSPTPTEVAAALWEVASRDTLETRLARRNEILGKFGERAFLDGVDQLWEG